MWVRSIFSVACLGVAVYHVVALILHRRTAREENGRPRADQPQARGYELSHLAMALGMAAMFSPLGDPVPPLVWWTVFGLASAWFATCLLRAPLDDLPHYQISRHHLVANLAMLFMLAAGHFHGGTRGGPAAAGHQGHTAAMGGGWIEGPIGTGLTVVLAGYFVVHTLRSLRLSRAAVTPGQPELRAAAAGSGPVMTVLLRGHAVPARLQAGCHAVIGTSMAVMFGLMVWS